MRQNATQSSQLLGVSPDASIAEIKKAYRKIAKRLHPDRNGGDQTAFRRITAAYQNLLTQKKTSAVDAPKARAKTNKWSASTQAQRPRSAPTASSKEAADTKADFGDFKFSWSEQFARVEAERNQRQKSRKIRAARSQKMNQVPGGRSESSSQYVDHTPDSDWHTWRRHIDSMNQTPGDAEDVVSDETENEDTQSPGIWGWLKKQKRHLKTHRTSFPGVDVKLRLKTTEQTLLFGGEQRIALQRLAVCPSCQGQNAKSCEICRGTGRVKVREELVVHVPPSATSGTQLRVPGKGTAGLCSHPDGDLILLIEPVLSSGFQVDGFQFLGTLRVTKSLANRGGVVEIDVPRGKVKVRIPAGACAGTKLRLRGQGLENPETGETGDVMLNLRIGH